MKKLISLVLALVIVSSFVTIPALSASAQTLTVDMSQKTGAMRHGSAGFLYGLGSDGTPSATLLTPLKPGTAVQKAPDGLQHPTGDVLDVADTFISAGGEQVQIYLQDIYALWSYEYTGIDDYLEKIAEMVPKIVELRNSDESFAGKLVYIPFNEPDGIWYTNINSSTTVQDTFNADWKAAYNLIRSLDPDALIGGVSYATYQSNAMRSWIKFCVDNDCEPDYITWHELQTDKLSSFTSHLAHYRALEEEFGMTEREIIINEYAPQADCSVPGKLVNWIALFEENKVSGCLPYWHNAGNLNDIAADNNEPNGAWWLYKWYGDMSGETLSVTTSTSRDALYGLASIDDNKKSANVIFGGVDGETSIVLENIDETAPFDGASAVDIKVEATYWTAYHGVAEEPTTLLSGTFAVIDGAVTVTLDTEATAAYNITVTQAASPERAGIVYYGSERVTYEAEEAVIYGNAYSNSTPTTYAYSGDARLSGIQSSSDGYNLTFSVSKDGYYKMDIVYGNGYGLNTSDTDANNPQTLSASLRFDNGARETILLENTLRDQMQGMYSDYVYLTKGQHTLSVRGTSDNEGSFSNDCVSFTYCGAEEPVFDSVYEAELGDFNILLDNTSTTLTTESSLSGYSASGYITGLSEKSVRMGGGVRFTLNVPDNDLYSITFRYSAENDANANIYLNNTALDLDNLLTTLSLPASDGFVTVFTTAFLQKGINIIDIDTDAEIAFDYLRVRRTDADETISVEAEDCTLSGNAEVVSSVYASNGAYVSNIEGATDDSLTVNVTVPESGDYKMTVYFSSGELFGAHSYNAQIVDRYASFSVNGSDPERRYFKNSYSDENWRTLVLDVSLNEGENEIVIYNDNWRILTCGTLKDGTSEHLPENIDYHTLVNYTPNFDKFEFTPALSSASAASDDYKISIFETSGGSVTADKSYVSPGDSVTLSFSADYQDSGIEILANETDISLLLDGSTLTYTPETDTTFYVSFTNPENLDNYIANSSFGSGDFTGWSADDCSVETDGTAYYAKIGTLSQTIDIPEGYYTISFIAKGDSLTVNAGYIEQTLSLSSDWETYSVRAYSNGSINLSLTGSAFVDEFSLLDNVDSNLLYFVDAGDSDVTTLSDGDKFGVNNSVTDQFFAPDPVTGYSWGVDDTYSASSKYPDLLTGAETWPYEYDTSDGRDKIVSFRYAKDQDDTTGSGVTYKFELPDGLYSFEVGFYAPTDWMASVNRKATLSVNGTALAQGIVPKTDADNPIIVKAVAEISGGYASLNIKLDSDGAGGPMMSYIKIAEAREETEYVKLDTSFCNISGSATWNDVAETAAKYAFDGDTSTFFDGISGGWLMIDLGSPVTISAIGFIPRTSWNTRMTATRFYGSTDGANWELMFTIPSDPEAGIETIVHSNAFINGNQYRYIKYQNPYDYCNVAEINIYKEQGTISYINLDEEAFLLTDISLTDDGYALSCTGSASFIQADNDNALYKITPISGDTTIPQLSENEEIYIWDMTNLKPLTLISK
ncbi:MAG: discoidin domain-containing protein [Clostridia bacterium]|nr:discoidin domain-containing protein [Clostridia bacterium]